MIELSDHFCENWQARVGNWPTERLITSIVRQSVPVHPCMDLRDDNGNRYRVYAIYWHPDLDVIIKIDEIAFRAVTVLSRENYNQRNSQRIKEAHANKSKKTSGKTRSHVLPRRSQRRQVPVRKP